MKTLKNAQGRLYSAGSVRYAIVAEPITLFACHWRIRCQTVTGSGFDRLRYVTSSVSRRDRDSRRKQGPTDGQILAERAKENYPSVSRIVHNPSWQASAPIQRILSCDGLCWHARRLSNVAAVSPIFGRDDATSQWIDAALPKVGTPIWIR